jgi:tetratricopeptide (TPR) repeat protein
VALVAAGALFWWLTRRAEPATPARSGKPAIAVLYFDNHTGEASLDWMRTGLADMMVTDLSQSRDIEVLGTDRLYQILAELRRADDRTLAPEVVQQVAQRAGVDTLLVGSYIKAGDAIRINARLQEVSTGRVLTSERVEGVGEASLFSLVDELTRRIKTQIASLRSAVPPAIVSKPGTGTAPAGPALDRDLADVSTSSIEAYRAYVEGMSFHERGLYAQAMAPFKRAVEIDPHFGMAFAKLAVVHNNLGLSQQRDEYAKRALDQIDRLPTRERYYIQGLYYTPRPETRERGIDAYKQGLALHPEHHAMRHNLGLMYFLTERFRDAIPHYEELIGRGTTTASTHGQLAMSFVSLGEVQRGREVIEAYLRRYPESGQGLRYYGEALLAEGRLDDAHTAFERSATLNPGAYQTRMGLWSVAVLQSRAADAEAVVKQLAASKSPFEKHLSVVLGAEYAIYRGRAAEAQALLDRGARDPDVDPEDRARVLTQLAVHLLRQKRAAAALVAAQEAMREARNTLEELRAAATLAVVQAAAGRQADANRSLAQLEAHAKLWPGPRGQRAVHWARGNVARAGGDRTTAAAELTKAESLVPANSSLLGPQMLQATVSFDAATANSEAGREDAALKLFEHLQAAYEHTFDLDAYARSFYLLAGIHERRGDPARARERYSRFLDLWRDGDMERGWVAEAKKKTAR